MKAVMFSAIGLIFLAGIAMVIYVLWYDKTHPVVPCFIIADNAPVYRYPGRELRPIRVGAHGMVDVVGQKGDWCKLSDGTYMPSYCLTPIRSGETFRQLP